MLREMKTVTSDIHQNNCEAKPELKVDISGELLLFFHVPTYFHVKLFQQPSISITTLRHCTKLLLQKIFLHVTLLRQLGLGLVASAKILWIATLSLVYSTVEHCALVCCHIIHTHLFVSVLNGTLCIVIKCLHLTPTDNPSILDGIQPAGLCHLGPTLFFANCSILDPDNILHDHLVRPMDAQQERLKSRCPFVPAAQKLLNNALEPDVCVGEWTNFTWHIE